MKTLVLVAGGIVRVALICVVAGVIGCGGASSNTSGGPAPSQPDSPVPVGPQLRMVAGSVAGPGSTDGQGSLARFHNPTAIAYDKAGNAYVADAYNFTIRKITPERLVTTLAGVAQQPGSVDGPRGQSRLSDPAGVAVDAAGAVYVTETGDNTIRRISPDGVMTTIAGKSGEVGYVNGTGADARFNQPTGIAVDAGGNVFVADSGNSVIRKISPSGIVSTLTGQPRSSQTTPVASADGPADMAKFLSLQAIAIDAAGNLFAADGHAVRRIDPTGTVTTVAGKWDEAGDIDGTAANARFTFTTGIAVDAAGNLYVGERQKTSLRKISASGQVTRITLLPAAEAMQTGLPSVILPTGIAVAPDGSVVVTSGDFSLVAKVAADGAVTLVAGTGRGKVPDIALTKSDGTISGIYEIGRGLAQDAQGNFFMGMESELWRITPNNELSVVGGWASDIEFDAAGNMYVVSFPGSHGIFFRDVYKRTPAGIVTSLAPNFDGPQGVTVDKDGNVYVSEYSSVIRKITAAGEVTIFAGTQNQMGSADGPGTAASFNFPEGVAVDAQGNVYVADSGNSTIRKITPAGLVSTLAGVAGQQGAVDGLGPAARFASLGALTIDQAGNLFVADRGNSLVRKITPEGLVSTYAGRVGVSGIQLGDLPGALSDVQGLAATSNGLYIKSGKALLLAK